MTLTQFLLARIAEDEAQANLALSWWPRHDWEYTTEDWQAAVTDDPAPGWAQLIAAWEPKRVLAECEAKRRAVAWAALHPTTGRQLAESPHHLIPHVLNLLALPYADHPDYQNAWRP